MRYPKLVSASKTFLEERKAEDVQIIDVKSRTPFADYFILATAPNCRALGAYAEELQDFLDTEKLPVRKIDGTPESEWIIVDADQIVIHLFTAEKRKEIGLDELLDKSKETK